MDNRNVFIAIALSLSVLLFWSAFFETPKPVNEGSVQKQKIEKKNEGNSITPNIDQNIKIESVTREESIGEVERVKIENKNIVGSISLTGALIDDVSFKNHKQDLKNKKNVEFLNPKQSENGFYVEKS